ncbi:class I SAM-dependent methyltransferase [Streptomyces sp. MN03-5084-2B]|jgi:dTDP-3-amino-3,4,6-trideoxy-alpha-D-glucopyranose N,N-dimethyltransferase|nr:class I SAM-dependent methyltransferase [Streptomyces sp. MN03-5084-2B]
MYENGYVEVYDLLMRNRPKDYAAEAADVARLARERKPGASSLLDVACGTGLHLEHSVKLFDRVVGLDQSADMLAFARRRMPGLDILRGDMRDFDAGAKFDVITCMFAVPHLDSAAELQAMVDCFVRHLEPGGVLVVEPWRTTEQFTEGYVATDLIEAGEWKIFRASHSTYHPDRADQARMVVHYASVHLKSGIQHFTDTVELTFFEPEHYEAAFRAAGCRAEFLPGGRFTQGLWIAQRD